MAAGRPREFDADAALEKALRVFWEKGYEGTSMPDLTKAMGINRPSLYAAFGNKEALFRKALKLYTRRAADYTIKSLDEPTARASVEHFLRGIIDMCSCSDNPRGCLLVQAALACGKGAEAIRKELVLKRAEVERLLCLRFERAKKERDLPKGVRPIAVAKFYATVVHGMAVEASSGASPADLEQIVQMALNVFPR
jgi:AcrR family transcriptional regulator